MSDQGYVYILINPSMGDLVKIGKTQRSPEDRAKELSSATGVPTPFYLAYKDYFHDCSRAEEFIHDLLKQKGYQISENREFFHVPLHVAIETIQEAKRVLEKGSEQQKKEDVDALLSNITLYSDIPLEDAPGVSTFKIAEKYYYGIDDTLQDYSEAFKLFNKAAKLGCHFAYLTIGRMYRLGEGCIKDDEKALEQFKLGIKYGDYRCWAEMAQLYFSLNHYENMRKCWKHYFESDHFRNNITYEDTYYTNKVYAASYLIYTHIKQQNFGGHGIEFKENIYPLKEKLIEFFTSSIQTIEAKPNLDVEGKTRQLYRKILNEIKGWT